MDFLDSENYVMTPRQFFWMEYLADLLNVKEC
jgi:hypothetical protein